MKMVSLFPYVFSLCALWTRVSGGCLEEDPNDVADASFDVTPHLGHITSFSLDLLRELGNGTKGKNIFMSPYSIWNALALAYLGSGGETEKQLQEVLKTRGKVDTLKQWRAVDYVYVMRQLQSREYRFGMSNKAYFQESVDLQGCIHQVLSSELEKIDFRKPKEASETINSLIGNLTDGYITKTTSPSDLEDVQMALLNAAFFRDKWKTTFKKSNTKRESFYPFSGQEQFVDMMRHKGPFKHGISEELRSHVLEVPYSMKDISMFLFLPPSLEGEKGLEHLLQKLTADSLEQAISRVWFDNIDVYIPKMTFMSSFGSDLKQALKNMGIKDLFDESAADLTSFVPKGGIHVSKILHQTYVEVSEEGTEAASATVALGRGRSARPSTLRSFICDHPFVFVIYDKLTRNILFLGVFKSVT